LWKKFSPSRVLSKIKANKKIKLEEEKTNKNKNKEFEMSRMCSLRAFFVLCLVLQIWISIASGASRVIAKGSGLEGKLRYQSLDSKSDQLYLATEGKYNPDEDKWKYKPDNKGKYVHVHIPYDGEWLRTSSDFLKLKK
jgi:hypothetical protein